MTKSNKSMLISFILSFLLSFILFASNLISNFLAKEPYKMILMAFFLLMNLFITVFLLAINYILFNRDYYKKYIYYLLLSFIIIYGIVNITIAVWTY